MFNKITSFSINKDDVEILDNELVKTASEILLPDGHQYDPDFVYMKVRAVSAGEYWGCNKNADFFPEEELKKSYKTFFDAHVFKNHENKEVEKAIGDVLDATWNDEMKYVELFIRVDKRIAPTIARGFEKGFMTDVSMGCKIDHSICSICGNLAKTQSQYCNHVKYEKHKVYDDGKKVYEININPKFHDISAVLNGADRTAKMTGLFISGTKLAYHGDDSMEKCASTLADSLFDEPFTDGISNYQPQKQNREKIAFDLFDSVPLFEKTASTKVTKKASELEKIAEIKKRIKGNILAVAQSRAELAEKERINEAAQAIRVNGIIRPLSVDTMNRFADGINRLSDREEVMAEQVLTAALKMLALAGVNLTPPEFIHIMRRVIGVQQPKVVRVCPEHVNIEKMMSVYDGSVNRAQRAMEGTTLPTMFNIIRSVAGRTLPVIEDKKPSVPAMIVIRKVASCDGVARPEVPGLNLEDKVLKLASEIIEERSLHLPQLTKRAMEAEYEAELEKQADMLMIEGTVCSKCGHDRNVNDNKHCPNCGETKTHNAKAMDKEAASKLCTTCANAGEEVYARLNDGFHKTDRQDRDAAYVKCSENNGAFKHKNDVCSKYEKKKITKEASIGTSIKPGYIAESLTGKRQKVLNQHRDNVINDLQRNGASQNVINNTNNELQSVINKEKKIKNVTRGVMGAGITGAALAGAKMLKKASIIDHYYDYLATPNEKVASEDVFEAIERQAYGVYQNLVVDYVQSREFNADLYKFANEIGVDNESMEKCAKNVVKSLNAGVGALMYGKYQNVKAREGAPQTTFNRTVAENPELTAVGTFLATKGALDGVGKAKDGAKKAIRYIAKRADENMSLYLGDEIEEMDIVEDLLQDIDIFKDEVITERMAKEYTPKQIELIKTASIMYAQNRQDLCDNLLSVEGLGYEAVNNFLQTCEDTLFEELEKKAAVGNIVGKLVGGATKAVGSLATKAKPVMDKAVTGMKNVGSQAATAFNNNATPGMKSAVNKVGTKMQAAGQDIKSMNTASKIGLGASMTGVGIGTANFIRNKKRPSVATPSPNSTVNN